MLFRAVSDPDAKQDCATVEMTTGDTMHTVEYGAFSDGDVLNVPTASHNRPVDGVVSRVDREPADTAEEYAVYDVDDLPESEAAELVVDAVGGWDGMEVVSADLRTIEVDRTGLLGQVVEWFEGRGQSAEA